MTATATTAEAHHGWVYRRVSLPLLALLRMGTTPEKLAWSLAVGMVVGLNPLIGSTTLVCLAVILALRLNTVAGQLANHLMYPLEIVMMVPFIRAGERIFGTGPLPMGARKLLAQARLAPEATVRMLWMWEWHALVAWGIFAVVALPLLGLGLTPVLRHTMAYRERQKQRLNTD